MSTVMLSDRLALDDAKRYEWLQQYDTFLIRELSVMFRHFLVRGSKYDVHSNQGKLALDYFARVPELDYFIHSTGAPTHNNLKYVKQSRILYYRPGHSWNRGRDGMSHMRPAACRYVRLKKQILTIFDEELYIAK